MARKNRAVANRLKSLQPIAPTANFTLAGVEIMCGGSGNYKELHCTINGYCRTQIFQFPGINFHSDGIEPHHSIYDSRPVQACIVSNLNDYFMSTTRSKHYAISPCLRHVVSETDEKIRYQQRDKVPVFLIIEEYNELPPLKMSKGECRIVDEVRVRDGEKVPVLIGGREGEQFITAWATVDGAWPELPNNQQLVNMILAGVRAGQEIPDPIRKYVDQKCLVTDDGRFVEMMQPTASMRGTVVTPMDANAYRDRVSIIKDAIAGMEADMGIPHMALLMNSMYCDEHGDDSYKRLQYLRLWQSLMDAGKKYLDYQGNIKYDKVVVAGDKTLEELTDYRDAIAHWWTDTIDENYLADLQRTINELIRRKYFKKSSAATLAAGDTMSE